MLERIVELSIRQRFAVLAAVFIFAAVGIYSFGRLKIETSRSILKFYQSRKNSAGADPATGRQPELQVH